MAMPNGVGTLFAPGEVIQHVTILAVAALASDYRKVRYTVRYRCCGREGNLGHGHLYGLAHNPGRRDPIKRCRYCLGLLAQARHEVPRVEAIPVGQLWPIPPSLAPVRPGRAGARP